MRATRILLRAFFALTLAAVSARAQTIDSLLRSLPAYQPEQDVAGLIRTWGHGSWDRDFMGELVKSWEEGFRKYHPRVRFDTNLRGTASAIGGLYTGAADIALMGREIWPVEIDAYQQVFPYKPFEVSVITGSLDVRNHDFALVIFVHKDNPLSKLTLAQVDAIFGADHRRGPRNIRTWGELGLTGEWADQPISVYGFGISRGFSQFFEDAVMGGSRKWNCAVREFSDLRRSDGSLVDAGQQIVDALVKDRYGMALSSLLYKNPLAKPVALAPQDGGPYYEATQETVIQRKYPLTRTISIFIPRAPGQPIDPTVKEYLRYLLSREGQEAVVRDGGYLPLNPDVVRQERSKIE